MESFGAAITHDFVQVVTSSAGFTLIKTLQVNNIWQHTTSGTSVIHV